MWIHGTALLLSMMLPFTVNGVNTDLFKREFQLRCILPAIKNYVPATVKEVEVVNVQADPSHIIQGPNSAKKPAHTSINAKKRSNKCILSEQKKSNAQRLL